MRLLSRGAAMTTAMNVFLREGNVEIYLTRLHGTWQVQDRDVLLRLLVSELDQMGESKQHLENGQRRVADGARRLRRLRELREERRAGGGSTDRQDFELQTSEKTQALLEAHVVRLRRRFEQRKL